MQELITDTVVGAVIGSFITLFGVWLSNRYQQKSKKDDREYILKSEIYMAAAEHLVKLKILLFKLPNVSQEEMNEVSAEGTATAKLTIIASNETVQAVTELSTAIAAKLLQLLPEKAPLDGLRSDIRIISSQLDGSFQKQNQMLNEMTAYNLRSDNNPVFWQKLQDNFDHYSSQIDSLIEDQDEKEVQLNQGTKKFFIKCIEAGLDLTEMEIKAISCVRKELEMPFDEEKYRRTVNDTNKKMQAEFSKFLVRIPDAS